MKAWWYAPLAAAVAGAVVASAAEAGLAADARLQVLPDGALGHLLRYVHLHTGHHHGGFELRYWNHTVHHDGGFYAFFNTF